MSEHDGTCTDPLKVKTFGAKCVYEALEECQALIKHRQTEMAANFGGMKISLNKEMPDNEIMIVCGKNAYKILISQAEGSE